MCPYSDAYYSMVENLKSRRKFAARKGGEILQIVWQGRESNPDVCVGIWQETLAVLAADNDFAFINCYNLSPVSDHSTWNYYSIKVSEVREEKPTQQ